MFTAKFQEQCQDYMNKTLHYTFKIKRLKIKRHFNKNQTCAHNTLKKIFHS